MINEYLPPKPTSFEERYINKHHATIRESLKAAIDKYNFKVKFIEDTWAIKEYHGGFDGHVRSRELTHIKGNIEFGVLSVEKDKKKQCSIIHVWQDGMCDGMRCRLINIPNGLFNEIH